MLITQYIEQVEPLKYYADKIDDTGIAQCLYFVRNFFISEYN